MGSNLIKQLAERLTTTFGKKRTGPFSRPHYRLALDLADVRNRIAGEPNAAIRSFLKFALTKGDISRSQILQDAFVLYVLGEKKGGFFCEFGSTNGVALSNSYLLELRYGWKGICAEPARNWHAELTANRPNAIIETACVWSRTGENISFSESRYKELSTIAEFKDADGHARRRRNSESYQVSTISLTDMLTKHKAPADLDYLSIDTEGSELVILQAHNFKRFRPKIITVEHNYAPNREALFALLTGHGYTRVLPEISLFDDWYIAPGITLPAPRQD